MNGVVGWYTAVYQYMMHARNMHFIVPQHSFGNVPNQLPGHMTLIGGLVAHNQPNQPHSKPLLQHDTQIKSSFHTSEHRMYHASLDAN